MKKNLVIFGLCFSLGLAGQQIKSDLGKTTVSVQAGYLHSVLHGADRNILTTAETSVTGNSWTAGVSVRNPISERFALMHELLFQHNRYSYATARENEPMQARLDLQSVRLHPASAHVHFGKLQLGAGLFVEMLSGASLRLTDRNGKSWTEDPYGTDDHAQEDEPYLNKTDYGVVLHASYEVFHKLLLSAHFSQGFAGIYDNSNSYAADDTSNRHTLRLYRKQFGIRLGVSGILRKLTA